jgi:biopolymer transport protein ExbB/TolQ
LRFWPPSAQPHRSSACWERSSAFCTPSSRSPLQKTSGIGAVAGGISEALVTTAFGLLVAIPAVMAFNYFTGRVLKNFDVEMDNSSSELVDYFIKQSNKR